MEIYQDHEMTVMSWLEDRLSCPAAVPEGQSASLMGANQAG